MRALVLLAVLFLLACSGSENPCGSGLCFTDGECQPCGSGGGAGGGGGGGGGPPRTERSVSWLYPGNFWCTAWSEIEIKKAFLGNASGTFDVGSYTMKLGPPVQVGDLEAYPLLLDGDTEKYAPRWDRLGANRYGDVFGFAPGSSTPVLLFSPELATWPGTGFITTFDGTNVPVNRNASVVPSGYTTNKAYFAPPLVALGTSSSEHYGGTGCTYFENYGTICGSDPADGPTRSEAHLEYWAPTAGPVAMHQAYNYESCTGDCAINRWEKRVEVWFFGDVRDGNSALEDEPNVFASPTVLPVRAQLFNMLGNVNHSDPLSTATGTSYSAHDWYRFELTTAGTADLYLYWGDTTQDFEMNLFTAPDSAWGFRYLDTSKPGTIPEFKKSRFLSGQFQPGKFLVGVRRTTATESWTGYGLMSIRD
jgi:hypothetical protein